MITQHTAWYGALPADALMCWAKALPPNGPKARLEGLPALPADQGI